MYTEPAAVYDVPCIVEECWRSQGISNKKRRARPARWKIRTKMSVTADEGCPVSLPPYNGG